MSDITRQLASALVSNPVDVALLLTDFQIEEVIAAFVAVLHQKKNQHPR